MAATVYCAAVCGMNAELITVETIVSSGLGYLIVGLPDDAVKESLFRVESAITSAGYHMPRQKILINMAPASLRKSGAVYDLAIAVSILMASGQLSVTDEQQRTLFAAELSLNGGLRAVKGVLSMTIEARKNGLQRIIVPIENAAEAALADGIGVYGFGDLKQVIAFLSGSFSAPATLSARHLFDKKEAVIPFDMSQVLGQQQVKRALEIAAAGRHNVLLCGPPGSGKTMLARRLPGILPPLGLDETLELTRIYSAAGNSTQTGLVTQRPFRAPHHTASDIALVGGGSQPQPGEISLAHHGILFLDELPEFKRRVLEVLRQPLEEKMITVSRANYSTSFPADFLLVAAMNPCPCGYLGHPARKCHCALRAIQLYQHRISGPLLERIDLHINVQPVSYKDLSAAAPAESSVAILERVIKARQFARTEINLQLAPAEQSLLLQAMEKHQLSARSYQRILAVARTIANLAGFQRISLEHLAEAISYRAGNLER